jgi:hypothetical protein
VPRISGFHRFRAAGFVVLLLAPCAFPPAAHAQTALIPTVRFGWPLAWPLGHPRLRITNYYDHDPSPRILDYYGGTLTYDGHQGTDYNINSFEDMDVGVPVLAAANGSVVSTEDGNYDRETLAPGVPWNVVVIAHGDGTTSIYGHLRTHSVTVVPGEYAREGQMIGFMGSSGLTTGPHLHFEVHTITGFAIDPYGGSANLTPSLWKHQENYVGYNHLHVYDLGVTTGSAFLDEGGLSSGWTGFKERPSQPAVFGGDEPTLKVWCLVDGQVGEPLTMEVHRPDGSLFASQGGGVPARNWGQTWQYWDLPFTGHVTPAEYGEWYAEILSGGAVVTTDRFTVGETSVFAPRFHWVGGRSFHLSSQTQEDVFSLSFLGAPMEELAFTLENAPSNVSFAKDDAGQTIGVLIGPATPDLASVRSREFAVVATDPLGLQDRMHYHLVNDAASTLGSPPAVAAPGIASVMEGDSVVVDVLASDADGDSIATLTASLTSLPGGSGATFTSGSGNTSGRLVWHTAAGSQGTYTVTFLARTSFGATPNWGGYTPIVQSGSATTVITIASQLRARAFAANGDKTLRLFSEKPKWCVYVEPMNSTFGAAEIDPASIQLVSHGTGSVDRISAGKAKRLTVGDVDRNSIPEIEVCFSKGDLRNLFSAVTGRPSVDAVVEGKLFSGAGFTAPISIDVQASHGGPTLANFERGPGLALSPNPARGGVMLSYRTAEGAPGQIDVFDVAGRRVKQIELGGGAGAGGALRTLYWDGRGRDGSTVPSGIYWVQLTTGDKHLTQRVVLLESR